MWVLVGAFIRRGGERPYIEGIRHNGLGWDKPCPYIGCIVPFPF